MQTLKPGENSSYSSHLLEPNERDYNRTNLSYTLMTTIDAAEIVRLDAFAD